MRRLFSFVVLFVSGTLVASANGAHVATPEVSFHRLSKSVAVAARTPSCEDTQLAHCGRPHGGGRHAYYGGGRNIYAPVNSFYRYSGVGWGNAGYYPSPVNYGYPRTGCGYGGYTTGYRGYGYGGYNAGYGGSRVIVRW